MDKCELCGHKWHGMECLSYDKNFDLCGCPSAFKDKYEED